MLKRTRGAAAGTSADRPPPKQHDKHHRPSSAVIHRSADDLPQPDRPLVGGFASPPPEPATPPPRAATHATHADGGGVAAAGAAVRRAPGGGGAGMRREKRHDAVRSELVQLDGSGIQARVIQEALDRSLDSVERKAVCDRQRQTKRGSPTCPLSPVPPKQPRHSVDERCDCKLSYKELAIEHAIGSPSLVRRAALARNGSTAPSRGSRSRACAACARQVENRRYERQAARVQRVAERKEERAVDGARTLQAAWRAAAAGRARHHTAAMTAATAAARTLASGLSAVIDLDDADDAPTVAAAAPVVLSSAPADAAEAALLLSLAGGVP
jgi:hypothetical protein